jgi:hypothetical protein
MLEGRLNTRQRINIYVTSANQRVNVTARPMIEELRDQGYERDADALRAFHDRCRPHMLDLAFKPWREPDSARDLRRTLAQVASVVNEARGSNIVVADPEGP